MLTCAGSLAALNMADKYDELTEDQISKILDDSTPVNTKRATQWSVCVFKGMLKQFYIEIMTNARVWLSFLTCKTASLEI
jgi:hypothetical protein